MSKFVRATLIAACLHAAFGTAQAAAAPGDLRQKPDIGGCISEHGTGGDCVDGIVLGDCERVSRRPKPRGL